MAKVKKIAFLEVAIAALETVAEESPTWVSTDYNEGFDALLADARSLRDRLEQEGRDDQT